MEEWRDVEGYEGIYKISNHGTLISHRQGFWKTLSNKNKNGWYLTINLYDKNNVRHTERIHRLVYKTFVGDIPTGYHVHHIDGNMQNNVVYNLVATSVKEHRAIHIAANPNHCAGMIHYNKYVRPKTIQQYSLDGEFIAEYANSTDAQLATGVCHRNILQVANKTEYKPGKIRKQAGGYIWRIKD